MRNTCLSITNVYMSQTEKLYAFRNVLRLVLLTQDVSVYCETDL